jgi:ATP-dependent DNA helicase RecG
LKGVGPKRARIFSLLGVHTVGDLLRHYPREWEDRRPNLKGVPAVFRGRVLTSHERPAGPALRLFLARVASEEPANGDVECVWFKRASRRYDVFSKLKDEAAEGASLWIVGRAEPTLLDVRKVQVVESYPPGAKADIHVNRIVPVHPLTEGLSAPFVREMVAEALRRFAPQAPDILPKKVAAERRLLAPAQALWGIHFPKSSAELAEARRRLAYEQFLLLELAFAVKRRQTREIRKGYGYEIKRTLLTPFRERLGFDFTAAQKKVINEIFADLRKPQPMTRLLQGDVGSGKTVVALAALLLAVENGYQGAFMAPTEILAEQHAWTIRRFLEGLPVRAELVTSRTKPKERERILADAEAGKVDILVGTHAVLEADVKFKQLKLIVIDEQHRFGVRQRSRLRLKGAHVDLLAMTATPIPRTLALALYGDLDVSTIDEMPPGRRPVDTTHVAEADAFKLVREHVKQGRQAYIVHPVIGESKTLEIKSAKAEWDRLRTLVFPDLRVGLLHGQMKPDEKAKTMQAFTEGRLDVLVATPVVEVGVDVANATVMLVQNAERFGLANLHQLRGRVGRGAHSSVCLLVGEPATDAAKARLETLCSTHDGFKIGEEDLKLRGPGEILGTEQSGEFELGVADPIKDAPLLYEARKDADALLEADPRLTSTENRFLRDRLIGEYQEKWHWIDLA